MIRLVCPVEPAHGRVLGITSQRFGWYCPHRAHDGRPGIAGIRAFFTTAEVEAAHLTDPPDGAASTWPGSGDSPRSRDAATPSGVPGSASAVGATSTAVPGRVAPLATGDDQLGL